MPTIQRSSGNSCVGAYRGGSQPCIDQATIGRGRMPTIYRLGKIVFKFHVKRYSCVVKIFRHNWSSSWFHTTWNKGIEETRTRGASEARRHDFYVKT